jgi:hypothetical protein
LSLNPAYRVFLRSATRAAHNARRQLLHPPGHLRPGDVAFVNREGFEACEAEAKRSDGLNSRWLAFYQSLKNVDDVYDLVCLTDARDVVFQHDPFSCVRRKFPSHEQMLLFGEEGMRHRESEWNLIDQFKYQNGCETLGRDDFKDWVVYNAGFLIGTVARVRSLCLLMWQATVRPTGASDQAAFNYLLHGPMHGEKGVSPLHPTLQTLVVTGEGFKYPPLEGNTEWQEGWVPDDGVIAHKQRGAWCVVHQWDRTPYKEHVLARYAD